MLYALIRKETQPAKQDRIEKPKLYVINLVTKVEEGNFTIVICSNCFITLYNAFPGKQYIILSPIDCFRDLRLTGKTTITKPTTKDVALTYVSQMNDILRSYYEAHQVQHMSKIIAEIEEVSNV